jgi:hypothetical protein
MKIYKLYKFAKAVIKLTSTHGNDYTLGNEVRSLLHKLKL